MNRVRYLAVALFLVASPACGQASKSGWMILRDSNWVNVVSAPREIESPRGAGFATFRISHRVGGPVGMHVVIESHERLPLFPFDRYDGPIDKTQDEFMELTIADSDPRTTSTLKVLAPNGGYSVDPEGGFDFTTSATENLKFLLRVQDGQRLSVLVNGPPSSIRVSFDSTGLKQLLDQMDLKQLLDEAPNRNGKRQGTLEKATK